jgi:FHA domain-containing protein
MQNGTARVGVEAGPGLVGRFGDVVILIAGDAAAGAEELLDLVEDAASNVQLPGAAIAARLAGWVGGRMSDDDTAFGVVAPVADGVVVFLRGAVRAEVTTSGEPTRFSGTQALTWVDQIVPWPFERLAVGGGGAEPVRVHPRSALQGGVVPGQGFVLAPSGVEPAATPARAMTAAAAPDPVADPPSEHAEHQPTLERSEPEPTQVMPPPRQEEPVDGNGTMATSQLRQDTPQLRQEWSPVAGETMLAPPPVGALVSEDGPTVVLDRSYVLGREPQHDPAVRSAMASPVVLRDPDNLISRVHARVSVDDGAVLVRDAPSVSGTYVAAPGAEDWTRVGTEPTPIFPNWSLRIGARVFVFQATRDPSDDRGRAG